MRLVIEENKMLNFSNNVNMVNKQKLDTKSDENDEDIENSENSFSTSKIYANSKLQSLRERREKSLNYAKNIKKPKVASEDYGDTPEERFVELDNNQYLLENQKIKMLFH